MKNNDDFLAIQGTVYTLVDADGYVVREDINGERKRYALEGEGGGGGGISESKVNDIVDDKLEAFQEEELNDVIDEKVNAKFEEYANKEW